MQELSLPSGATLKVQPAPFTDSKELYQAILEELKLISFSTEKQVGDVLKELACTAFSSKKIEKALWKCFERATYNNGSGDLRIDKDTFEPVEAREDYMAVCMEVAKVNISPFLKSLYAEYGVILAQLQSSQA